MKAIVNSQLLAKELKKVAPAIKKSTVIPILSCVLLEFDPTGKLTIRASDLETTIYLTMDCETKEKFSILMEFSDLLKVCSAIREPILIETKGDQILLTSDDSKFKFSKIGNGELFPQIPEDNFSFTMKVDSDFFNALYCANACRSADDLNPRMFGVNIRTQKDKVFVEGTDAFVAYQTGMKLKAGKESESLISGNLVAMVKGFGEAEVSVGDKFIKIETLNQTIVSTLFESKFVDLKSILKTDLDFNFNVNRKKFIESLELSGIAASISTTISQLNFEDGVVRLNSKDIDFGKEAETSLKAIHTVDFPAIAVNGSQMLKLLNLFDSEEVEIHFASANKTIFLRPAKDPSTICLIQPVMS